MYEEHSANTKPAVKLSVKEAAALLHESERAVWMKIYRKQIPHRRWGKRVFILTDELETFLKALSGVGVEEAIERAAGGGR